MASATPKTELWGILLALSSCVPHRTPPFDEAVRAPGVVLAWDHGGGHLAACSPSWRVLISADGTVRYEGRRSVAIEGEHTWKLPTDRVALLLKRAQPFLSYPPNDERELVDASPNCLFVRDGAHEVTRCFSPGHANRTVNEFGDFIAFKTNTVMWLGDPCRRE